MRTKVGTLLLALLVGSATVAVSGCKKADGTDAIWAFGDPARQGRYVGIGIYSPGAPWTKLVAERLSAAPTSAKLVDDQAVIVTTDSQTGEVRACGDLTGYCVGMNPWKQTLATSQLTPITLSGHVGDPEPPPAHHPPKRRPYTPASSPRAPPAAAPARS